MINIGRERIYRGGRLIPGYSLDTNGRRVCGGEIEEYIMELINGEAFGYGYYKFFGRRSPLLYSLISRCL